MEKTAELTLKSINGLTPEQYMKLQDAAEEKIRQQNRKEHTYYLIFVGVIALLASTAFQYLLVAIISVGGWVTLWYSQYLPIGIDGGMPRMRGMPPIFGLLLLLFPIAAIVAAGVFIYTLLW